MEKKYIVVNSMFSEQIIIFSSVLDHKTVSGDMNVISAGFIEIYQPDSVRSGRRSMQVHCYGESKTLGIKSRPKEDSILARILLKEDF